MTHTHPQGQRELSLAARAEAVLFVAGEPVSLEALARTLQADRTQLQAALNDLRHSLQERGLSVIRQDGTVQLTSAPQAAPDVKRYLQSTQEVSLSPAALETLSIVAYRQPVTRAQVEAIRGVNSDSPLRTLLRLGLITELERLEQPGRPITYGTTLAFLRSFGLEDLTSLPPLPDD